MFKGVDLGAAKDWNTIDSRILITLRACARGKVISFVCHLSVVVMKNRQSSSLRIYVCCNYHELVDISEKLASVCFELLNMAHQC